MGDDSDVGLEHGCSNSVACVATSVEQICFLPIESNLWRTWKRLVTLVALLLASLTLFEPPTEALWNLSILMHHFALLFQMFQTNFAACFWHGKALISMKKGSHHVSATETTRVTLFSMYYRSNSMLSCLVTVKLLTCSTSAEAPVTKQRPPMDPARRY